MNILIVVAHPDDEVLGCGGTIARLTAEGHRVRIAIVAEGCSSRDGQSRQEAEQGIAVLRLHAAQSAKILGAEPPVMLGLPDNRLDTCPLLEIVKKISRLVEEFQPETIYTHFGGDLNIDHGVVFRAVMTASRPIAGSPVKAIYAFEVPSSTEWAFGKVGGEFSPNLFVDVSNFMNSKILAMQAYDSEVRPFPHPRSTETLLAKAAVWGSTAGVAAAEAFMAVRIIV